MYDATVVVEYNVCFIDFGGTILEKDGCEALGDPLEGVLRSDRVLDV